MQLNFSDITSPIFGRNSCFLDINHIWFCNGSTSCRTSDAGYTWFLDTNKKSFEEGNSIQCVYFLDSLNGFEGGAGYSLFRTSDGGKNWNLVYDSASSDGSVYQIKFCTPKLGLALCGEYLTYILRTTDGGINWTNDTVGGGFAPTGLSYPEPHNAWYTDGLRLYHSTDSGLNWTIVADDPLGRGGFRSSCFLDSVHGIATSGDPDTLTFGYTSDGGKTWITSTIDSEGSYETFTSFPNLNTAYVGGRDAVYKLNIQGLSVPSQSALIDAFTVYPNPVSGTANIRFTTNASSPANVTVFDILGNPVALLFDGTLEAGAHLFEWNANGVESGTYYVRLSGDGKVQTVKIVKK
ncbi:MAG TPA: T9SS type A sorting domain-containing protein [Candidatus Kapabacteria bacterium]